MCSRPPSFGRLACVGVGVGLQGLLGGSLVQCIRQCPFWFTRAAAVCPRTLAGYFLYRSGRVIPCLVLCVVCPVPIMGVVTYSRLGCSR